MTIQNIADISLKLWYCLSRQNAWPNELDNSPKWQHTPAILKKGPNFSLKLISTSLYVWYSDNFSSLFGSDALFRCVRKTFCFSDS